MRILIWTDAFFPEIGGLEVFSVRLLEALQKRGHDCRVIAERKNPSDWGLKEYGGVPILGVSFGRSFLGRNLRSVRNQHDACTQFIEQFDPEIIHLNSVMRGAPGFVLQQRHKKRPTILTLHDNVLRHHSGMGLSLLANVEMITVVSESVRNYALEFDPLLESKLLTVLNALPIPADPPAPLPLPPRLLAFGRLVRDKGFDLAIRAFAGVAARFPEMELTVAGDGIEAGSLKELARESGFGERIHFPGWIDAEKIPAFINQHSIVLMPSRWREPFGLAALQAAQMGRPIISSNTGGLPEVVVDGVTGKLFENENLMDFTQALHLLLENPSLCARLGTQARLRAEKDFDFDSFVATYENLYLRFKDNKNV